MPRAMRVEYPGAIYHEMDRGDRREDIFVDDVDRQDFLKTPAEACQKTGGQTSVYQFSVKTNTGFVAGALAVALAWLASGCAVVKASSEPPAIVQGKTQAWYGRVNCWVENKAVLESDIKACAKNGVTGYIIELLSWGRYSVGASMKAQTEEAYKLAVKLCRENGMWLFVGGIANDNSGTGKYGDKGPKLSGQTDLLNWGLNLVLSQGPKNVIVQPVSEAGVTSFGKSWNDAAGRILKDAGFATVNNDNGGHPKSKPVWADWNSQHPCDKNTVVNGDLCISDCGMIIRQLMGGYDTAGYPILVRTWSARQKGHAPVVGFYAFKYPGPTDTPTIRAMAEGAKKGARKGS